VITPRDEREKYVLATVDQVLALPNVREFLFGAFADALADKARVHVLTTALQRIKAGTYLVENGSLDAATALKGIRDEIEMAGVK
jgi:hypothetical protein